MILIIDFGSQYTHLLARRVRELGVFSQIIPWQMFPAKVNETLANAKNPLEGVILSGGPQSVYENNAPTVSLESIENLNVPILGICYGLQLINHLYGGVVSAATIREYGQEELSILGSIAPKDPLFSLSQLDTQKSNVTKTVWMSHGDEITKLAPHFTCTALSNNSSVAAFSHHSKPIYGLQFHPEVEHSVCGFEILNQFVNVTCGSKKSWFLEDQVASILKEMQQTANQVSPNSKILCALSGGVDSTVAAVLARKAFGNRLVCVFVNNGLLRQNEYQNVLKDLNEVLDLNVVGLDASSTFLTKLNGISDPEKKRKIIGNTFIEVFEEFAKADTSITFLLQGTLYTDVIESVSPNGTSVTIKSHHNVGGLPERMNLKLIEPFRELFKDEVRKLGTILNIPKNILMRHPFPGPGLAIRILGPITEENLEIVRKADNILVSALKSEGLYDSVWQAFVVLLPVKSVGVMGDVRTYENTIAIRCVNASDGMTASWSELPFDFLGRVSSQIINQVRGINRVVYDISNKPPATIEWE